MRNRLEKKYNVKIDKCRGESGGNFWTVHTKDYEEYLFDAWTLKKVDKRLSN